VELDGRTWVLDDGNTRHDPIGTVEQLAQQLAGQLRTRGKGGFGDRVEGHLFLTEDGVQLPADEQVRAYCFRWSRYREMLGLDSAPAGRAPRMVTSSALMRL